MDAPPTVGADDVAQRMSIEGGNAYVDTLNGNADDRLKGLIGSSSVDSQGGTELEQMMRIRRSNMLLGLKREEADLAVGLWGALFNNEHAQAWRTREDTLAKERRDSETAATAAAMQSSAMQAGPAGAAPSAAMEQMPVVFEVVNGSAIILVPGNGEVAARVGTVLGNGMKVVGINGGSVVVERDGERFSLGLGSSSMMAPQPAQQQTQAANGPRNAIPLSNIIY